MNKFRTTKAINFDLHSDETSIIEFRYTYHRDYTAEGIQINTTAYAVRDWTSTGSGLKPPNIEDDFVRPPTSGETLVPVLGATSKRFISNEQIDDLCSIVSTFTPELSDDNLNCIEHTDYAVRGGIKAMIIQEHLWKDQLTMADFD